MKFLRNKWLSIGFTAALVTVVVIIFYRNKKTTIDILFSTDRTWILMGIACYGCNYLARAYRIHIYLKKKLPFFPECIKITSFHGFNSYFLPFRSGDLTLPFLLNLYGKISLTQGTRILIRARILDLFSLGILLTFTSFFSTLQIDAIYRAIFLAFALFLLLFPYIGVYLIKIKNHYFPAKFSFLLLSESPQTPNFLETVISLIIWFWTGATLFCVVHALKISLSFVDIWFLVAVQLPLQLLPLQGIAGAGNHEASWVVALGILGYTASESLILAISSHVILICYVATLGVVSIILPLSTPK
ncbi:lysylphosphatidylglycerol synthase domain-containing protein [Desulfocastanea catecholica]